MIGPQCLGWILILLTQFVYGVQCYSDKGLSIESLTKLLINNNLNCEHYIWKIVFAINLKKEYVIFNL